MVLLSLANFRVSRKIVIAGHFWRTRVNAVNTLIAIALLLWTVAIPAWWIQAGYQGVAVTEKLSFNVSDGWCDPVVQGVGRHCFGDFQTPQKVFDSAETLTYSNTDLLYPPSGFAPFVLVRWISETLDLSDVGSLWLYLGLSWAALSVPALVILFTRSIRHRLVLGFLIGPSSLPALMVLDRGNNLAFAIPFIFLYGVLAKNQRYVAASLSLAIVASFKPQLIVLFLLLIGLRQFRALLVGTLATGGLLALGFSVWPGTPIDNFRSWIRALMRYENYQPISAEYPANLSASRAVFQLSQITGMDFLYHPSFRLVVLLLVVATCVFRGRSMNFASLFFIVALCSFLVPDLSYHYYLAIIIPLAAILVMSESDSQKFSSWFSDQVQAALAAFLLVPLPIAVGQSAMSISPHFSGIFCLVALLIIVILAWIPEPKRTIDAKHKWGPKTAQQGLG